MGNRKWVAGAIDTPVWRDGLSTSLSYMIVAVKALDEKYNCVCIRDLGGYQKVKFYPDLSHWNITQQDLQDMGCNNTLDRTGEGNAGYFRVTMNDQQVSTLMTRLAGTRNVVTVSYDQYLKGKASKADDSKSRTLHPQSGGGTPASAEKFVLAKGTRGNPVSA